MSEDQKLQPENSTSEYRQYLDLIGAEESPFRMKLVVQDVEHVFYDTKGGVRTERGIAREVKTYQEVIRAKVAQLLGNQLFPARKTNTKQDFFESSRTKAKTAQELLTAETELQTFTREDIAEYGEEAVIQNVVVDPRRISDTMLRDFGLLEYIPTGKKLSPPDRMRMRASAIPAVKQFLVQGIEPLFYRHEELQKPEDQKYFRLFRITQGKNEGLILGIRDNEGEKPFLTNLHSAFRRVDHIEESYTREMDKLNRIQQILTNISERVMSGWHEIKGTKEFERMKQELCEIVESLQFVKNKHKLKIKTSVARCLTFKDKRSRLNPSSRLAILAPVNKFISQRIDETGRILGYLIKDKVRVGSIIMEQANVLADFHHDVEQHKDRLILLKPSKTIDSAAGQKIVTNLTAIKTQCQSFEFEPYLSLAKYVIEEIDAITSVLNSDQPNDQTAREGAKKSFIMIYIVSKLLKLEIDLAGLRDEFFAPGQKLENVYVKSLIERVKAIHEEFLAKKIAPEMRIREFGKIFGQVYELLGEIKKNAQQSLKRGAPKEQRVEALEQINKRLKAFNPYKKLQEQLGQMTPPETPPSAQES